MNNEVLINEQNQVVEISSTELDIISLGIQGPAGIGIPAAGSADQLLVKDTNVDYAVKWGPAITVGTSAPISPHVGDLWIDTN